jgi:hypothetical protein
MAKKANPFVPDRLEQIAVIRDIVYEYGNLMAAGYYDVHGNAPWRTSCDDAFLLGCRKLGDFLMNDNRNLDDVLALDYLPPSAARTWRLPIWDGTWREDMNKYLPHIAYKRAENRIALGLPQWEHGKWVPQLLKEFNNAWWDFREAIVDAEFAKEFDQQIASCKKKEGFAKIVLDRQ